MRKIIIALGIGQGIQLLLLWIGEKMTYSNNLFAFCAGCGIVTFVATIIGWMVAMIEMAIEENDTQREEFNGHFPEPVEGTIKNIFGRKPRDMEETAPIPEEIEVTNTNIKRSKG